MVIALVVCLAGAALAVQYRRQWWPRAPALLAPDTTTALVQSAFETAEDIARLFS